MKRLLPKTLVLSFDSDYAEDVQQYDYILALLKKHQVKASWACVGRLVEEFPEEHKRIVRDGHEILNHSLNHPDDFRSLNRKAVLEEVCGGEIMIRNILGIIPKGFRIPHFGKNFSFEIQHWLANWGFEYDSSAMCMSVIRTKPFKKNNMIEFPISTCPQHVFTAFDTWHSFRSKKGAAHTPDGFLKNFEKMLRTRQYINIYLDPQDCPKFDFERMLTLIKEHGWRTRTYEELVTELKE